MPKKSSGKKATNLASISEDQGTSAAMAAVVEYDEVELRLLASIKERLETIQVSQQRLSNIVREENDIDLHDMQARVEHRAKLDHARRQFHIMLQGHTREFDLTFGELGVESNIEDRFRDHPIGDELDEVESVEESIEKMIERSRQLKAAK